MELQTGKPAKKPRAAAPTTAADPEEAAPTTIPCFDPATLASLGEVHVVTPDEVRERVKRAQAAQRGWASSRFAERRRVLGRILDHVLAHSDELCEAICRDSGMTRENALMGEIWPVCEKLRHTIASGERDLRAERVSSGLFLHKAAQIEYHPLGVIGVICPWNFPLQNVLGPTIPALMAGNAVVVKVSEWTAWSAQRFQQIFDQVFDDLGYPRDLVQVIAGYAETGRALVGAGVDKIIFTGSMSSGRRVAQEAARTLTPVILELGGKDPMIVCDDADLEQAAHAALAGVFIVSGQVCAAAERIYVFDAIYDRFVARVLDLARSLRQGPPLGGAPVDVGAMTMPRQLEIVEALVKDAVDRGARLRLGGRRAESLRGQFFEPTILSEVTHAMRIASEEAFGPVMSILRVRSDEEAVRLANDSAYGLGSSVFSRDARRARRIADQLVAGSTVINDFGLAYLANALPFGGVRGSGYGRLNGREGIRALCNVKAVMTDRLPFHLPVKLFPVGRGDYERTRSAIELIYSRDWVVRARSAVRLARGLSGRLLGRRQGPARRR